MSRRSARGDGSRGDAPPIDWRRTGEGVELFEDGNPNAWIRVRFVAGVDPETRLFMVCPDCGVAAPHRSKPGRASACGNCGATFEHDRSSE